MRCCWLAALILCAVFPLYADAAEFDAEYAERLIWEGRLRDAVEYLDPRYRARPLSLAISPEARLLCLAYALWGYDQHTLDYCNQALTSYWHADSCVGQKQGGEAVGYACPADADPAYAELAEIKALQALAYWRSGQFIDAGNALYRAFHTQTPPPWLAQLVYIAINMASDQQIDASRAICNELDTVHESRCRLAFAAIFPAHAKTLQDAAEASVRRRRTYIIAGALGSIALLAMGAAYHQRARIDAFLRPPRRPRVETAPAAAPGYPTPYPSSWQAGYMNRAYQIAAWCWVAVWLLICLPLVLLLAIPAVTILVDFSAAGMQSGIANARGFAAGFLGWGRLWFGLLLLSLTGFAVTKMYGRYSLPKPFRPRIRVIRTTIRLVFLAVTVVSVGTFLMYFSGVAANLYGNPMVQLLIKFLRDMLGF